MRQFGTEQFSMTISHDNVPSHEQIKEDVATLGVAISEAFDKVVEREEKEKSQLTALSAKRQAANQAMNDQIEAEMKSASKGKNLVRDAEALNRRLKK